MPEKEDPDSYVTKNGKEAFLNLAKNSKTFSDYFLETIKSQDDLSSVEGRSMVARFALSLVSKITNDTLKQAYINEVSNICDLDFAKLVKGDKSYSTAKTNTKEEVKPRSSSVIRKSILGIFISLIQPAPIASWLPGSQLLINSN